MSASCSLDADLDLDPDPDPDPDSHQAQALQNQNSNPNANPATATAQISGSGSVSVSVSSSCCWVSGIDGRTQRQRGPDGRFLPVEGPPERPMQGLMRRCSRLLNLLMNHRFGYVFNQPVDPEALGIPDYLDVIKSPMDLGTIRDRLRDNAYQNPHEFAADVRLTFSNALKYNPAGDQVHDMARMLSRKFEVGFKTIETKVQKLQEAESATPQQQQQQQQAQLQPPEMSAERKRAIMEAFLQWEEDIPDAVVEFIRKHCTAVAEDGNEMELDVGALGNEALWELFGLVKRHLEASAAAAAAAAAATRRRLPPSKRLKSQQTSRRER